MPIDALRTASQAPVPGSLVRSLTSLTGPDTRRSRHHVEEALKEKIASVSGDDPQLPNMMRLAQGHWPDIYKDLEKRMRAFRESDIGEETPESDIGSTGPSF